MLPVNQTPNVTAGLKCAPETAATALTSTARTTPWASATASRPPGSRPIDSANTPTDTEPMPTKKNRNVPIASAMIAFQGLRMALLFLDRPTTFAGVLHTTHARTSRPRGNDNPAPAERRVPPNAEAASTAPRPTTPTY